MTSANVSSRLLGLADLHVHTSYSDGLATPEQVVAHALTRTRLNVIAITDHDAIEGAFRAKEVLESLRGPDRRLEVVDLDALVDYVQQLPQPFSAQVEGRITRRD